MSTILHPSAQIGFSTTADLYQKARPSYPDDIVNWLRDTLKLVTTSHVVDLGAGTGKFIPYIKQISQHITAVEPIAEMLEQLQQQHPDVKAVQTDSQNLTLAQESVDAIICAQSFHWFSDEASLNEMYYILKPHAHLGLIWNQRDTSVSWVKKIADLLATYEGDTPRFHQGTWCEVFEDSRLFELESKHLLPFLHSGTVEKVVVQRLLSTSFIAALSPKRKDAFRQKILDIIQAELGKGAEDLIDFPYLTHAYHYQKLG